MNSMRLPVRYLGELSLVATAKNMSGEGTFVAFTLVFNQVEDFGSYIHPYFHKESDGSLLHDICVKQGMPTLKWAEMEGWRILVFTRKVEGELRDPKQFLRAIAGKLSKELLDMDIEETLSNLEADEKYEREVDQEIERVREQMKDDEDPELDGIGNPPMVWVPSRRDRNLEDKDVIIS